MHGKGTAFPERLSLEKYVDEKTPPAFLCHTSEDTCVPSMNSLLFASALARANVAYELHIYKEGPHGMSLAKKESVAFLRQVFDPVAFSVEGGKLVLTRPEEK